MILQLIQESSNALIRIFFFSHLSDFRKALVNTISQAMILVIELENLFPSGDRNYYGGFVATVIG